MKTNIPDTHGKDYWRSLNQLADTPEYRDFLENEFPEGTLDAAKGMNRRKFLSLMGASMALAGLTSCRRPVEKIIPYSIAPEEIIPGIPKYYATSMPFGLNALGVIAESHEGRPTKLEGNPVHPGTGGASNSFIQAETLNLYDPDRSKFVKLNSQAMQWPDFIANWVEKRAEHLESKGSKLAFLSGVFNSPTLYRLKSELAQQFPHAQWIGYEPVSDENIWEGNFMATGKYLQPVYEFKNARVVLALDADFLKTETNDIANSKGFADARRVNDPDDEMNRLYSVESHFTVTGAMADHRMPLRSHEIGDFLLNLTSTLASKGLSISGADIDKGHYSFDQNWVEALADDLIHNQKKAIILAGRNQPAAVHALVYALNDALAANQNTIKYFEPKNSQLSSSDDLKNLADRIQKKEIDTLVVLDNNILYHAPADFNFVSLFQKIPQVLHWGTHFDETAQAANWHIPGAHFLESWGDAQSLDGTQGVIQPLIEPLFGAKSMAELLQVIIYGEAKSSHDLVRETWRSILPNDRFEKSWQKLLHDGILPDSQNTPRVPRTTASKISDAVNKIKKYSSHIEHDNLEIVFRPSPSVYDGRYANNGWIQENPDPMSKLTWDNAALISAKTAKSMSLKDHDLIELSLNGSSISLPIWIQPGHADNSMTLELGYGRTSVGRVGNFVGQNVYPLRPLDHSGFTSGAIIKGTGKQYMLASTQDHHGMDVEKLAAKAIQSRLPMIIREATHEEYQDNPEFAQELVEHPPLESLWKEHSYDEGYQWGMAVDLNVCTGCNACTIACQSENNIPVVGKEEVSKGREMHWMRMDRYFTGDPEHPEVAFQPVACQHCENAPCEGVCPVAATVHDEEGLNSMIYNRCIGTRYCANNCPYKVRRFNFFNYTKELPEIVQMAMNPDVTVRFRGVMEKCTYCTQRINRTKIEAKNDRELVKDGAIKTACEQTCPTGAIVFGNILDPESRVSKLRAEGRNYALLGELNVQPRTTYLAKLRNPNPKLAQTDNQKVKSHDH